MQIEKRTLSCVALGTLPQTSSTWLFNVSDHPSDKRCHLKLLYIVGLRIRRMCDNRLGLPFLYFRVAAEDTHPHPQIEIVD
jgi:hypothetical protein